MKSTSKFTLLYFVLFLGLFLNACNSSEKSETTTSTETIDTNAITWKPNVAEALAAAKKSGKLLFVECYSPTCPTCLSIEPFFSTTEVATKYNTEFINYKLDVGVAEQVKFLGDRNIWLPSFPQFLFFDGDGNLVHQAEVTANTESIIKAAKDALVPEMRSSKEKFEKWVNSLGINNVINKKSSTYRKLTEEQKQQLDAVETAYTIVKDNTSIIKRPVVEFNGKYLIGFDEEIYAERF